MFMDREPHIAAIAQCRERSTIIRLTPFLSLLPHKKHNIISTALTNYPAILLTTAKSKTLSFNEHTV